MPYQSGRSSCAAGRTTLSQVRGAARLPDTKHRTAKATVVKNMLLKIVVSHRKQKHSCSHSVKLNELPWWRSRRLFMAVSQTSFTTQKTFREVPVSKVQNYVFIYLKSMLCPFLLFQQPTNTKQIHRNLFTFLRLSHFQRKLWANPTVAAVGSPTTSQLVTVMWWIWSCLLSLWIGTCPPFSFPIYS